MRTTLVSLVAAFLCFAFLAVAAPAAAEAGRGAATKVKVVAGTDGHYYTKSKRFGGWSRVQIEGADPAGKKVTGREKVTHKYMPVNATTAGIHKAPVEGKLKRAIRTLQRKAPVLDGKSLPYEPID